MHVMPRGAQEHDRDQTFSSFPAEIIEDLMALMPGIATYLLLGAIDCDRNSKEY